MVGIRDDTAAEDDDFSGITLTKPFDDLWEQSPMGTGKRREPDGVDILLDGSLGDLGWCLVQSRVDHFMARITECAGNHFGTAIVAVETWLGNENSARHTVAEG